MSCAQSRKRGPSSNLGAALGRGCHNSNLRCDVTVANVRFVSREQHRCKKTVTKAVFCSRLSR
ncbi:hypothetical protein LG3211_1067 [Lysobacter gummosus]|nr:hypothetical protein LG3211_1067 [Lysobacter gummosus]